MRQSGFQSSLAVGAVLALGLLEAFAAVAQSAPAAAIPLRPMPLIVEKDGRYALMVDGKPYLMLGVQAHNSSAWPAYLGRVWPAAEALHANTVEIPVYWEQIEATRGKFDFSVVDTILKQAREHDLHLVLLWFGTWKNGSSHYTPEWIKLDQTKNPFLVGKDGQTLDSPSPFAPARLEADKTAFRALMRHLKEADGARTVLMVQVENEAGVWGGVRDYGAAAEKSFAGPVPEELVKGLSKQPGSWRQVFGDDADETFEAWYTADYIGQVAAAGKAEYPLPLYVNAALRDPLNPGRAPKYESGGPTDNNIELWKIAARSIDVVSPDIYMSEYDKYMKTIEQYKRFKNPLLIPETGSSSEYARYVFAAIGQGAIGWSPFGLDLSRHSIPAGGVAAMDLSEFKPVARQYALLGPIVRQLAKGNLEGTVRGSSEDPEKHIESLEFERWKTSVSYGIPPFGYGMKPEGNKPPDGGVVILQLGPDEFLVTGHHARVDFKPTFAPGKKRLWLKVEEGSYDGAGKWKMARIWNGDETDEGMNFSADENVILKVRITTY
jgi:hypothetical protein